MTDYLSIQLKPNYDAVRDLRKQLQESLEGVALESSLVQKVLLCFSEVATNFIEHSQDTWNVGLRVAIYRSKLEINVVEMGENNNRDVLHNWLNKELNEEDLFNLFDDQARSGGRGAHLVKSLADSAEIPDSFPVVVDGQSGWCNQVSMVWRDACGAIPLQILILEDEKALNSLYCAFLSPQYTSIPAYTVQQAEDALNTRHIDLILCDMRLPDRSGLDFRVLLADHEKYSGLPFILTSAYSIDEVKQCMQFGIDDFLPKPLTKQRLLESIERVIARHRQLKKDIQSRIYQKIHSSLQAELPDQLGNWQFALQSQLDIHGGGDLLLWEQKDGQVLLVVADVMGHDEAAKFFAHAYRGYMRGLLSAMPALPKPGVFLHNLSAAMYRDHLLSSSLCTVCALLLEPSGSIQVSSAGHPSPILINQSTTSTIHNVDMLPGLQSDIVYTSKQTHVKADERMLVYTDGLFDEHRIPGRPTDQEQRESLLGNLQAQLSMPIDQCLKLAYGQARQNHDANDDALMLLIEYRPT